MQKTALAFAGDVLLCLETGNYKILQAVLQLANIEKISDL